MNYKSISLIGGTLLLSTLTANGQKKNTQPNILFILCDDMGYGDLGCYGQPFIRTPHTVSYTHLPSPRDGATSRMPSSA